MTGSSSKSKSNTTSKSTYGNTTTSNPYITSTTNNGGTTSKFTQGSGAETFNNFYNSKIGQILNNLLNPSTETAQNQALSNAYIKNLNEQTIKNTENMVNNLSNRGLIRSSVANDMYNNLAKTNANNLADYNASLIANNQDNSTNLFNTLMNAYLQGWNVVNGNQAQSLQTSSGNATNTGTSKGTSYGLSVSYPGK